MRLLAELALDLAMPNWAATARTVTPLRNRAAASSRGGSVSRRTLTR